MRGGMYLEVRIATYDVMQTSANGTHAPSLFSRYVIVLWGHFGHKSVTINIGESSCERRSKICCVDFLEKKVIHVEKLVLLIATVN